MSLTSLLCNNENWISSDQNKVLVIILNQVQPPFATKAKTLNEEQKDCVSLGNEALEKPLKKE
jgi:hypothetical protein